MKLPPTTAARLNELRDAARSLETRIAAEAKAQVAPARIEQGLTYLGGHIWRLLRRRRVLLIVGGVALGVWLAGWLLGRLLGGRRRVYTQVAPIRPPRSVLGQALMDAMQAFLLYLARRALETLIQKYRKRLPAARTPPAQAS